MSASPVEAVPVLDLRNPTHAGELRAGRLVSTLVESIRRSEYDPGDGVIAPFSVVLLADPELIKGHGDLFEAVFHPAAPIRAIVMIVSEDDSVADLEIPVELSRDEARVIWLRNPAGTLWSPGGAIASGIGSWPHDPDGKLAQESLVSSLVIPEVFSAVFDATPHVRSQPMTVGLRRWIFSIDPDQSVGDFLHEAGKRIAGGDAIDPSLPEPRFWVLPPELIGEADSDTVFLTGEGSFGELLAKAENRVSAFGRLGDLGDLDLIRFKRKDLIARANRCLSSYDELIEQSAQVIEGVDARDGIDLTEHERAKSLGINLHPGYSRPSLEEVADQMLESVAWDLEAGHSLQPLLQKIRAKLP